MTDISAERLTMSLCVLTATMAVLDNELSTELSEPRAEHIRVAIACLDRACEDIEALLKQKGPQS